MWASLRVPNYRLWFIGATASNIGQWMARTAESWLVLTVLTNQNAQALGTITAITFTPGLLLSPFAGSLADKIDKRRIMEIAQIVLMIDAAILSVLIMSGVVQLWHVYLIALIDGIAGAIDQPARQAIVSEFVKPELLSNAISLNSASFNTARLLGPGLAGVLIAWLGTGLVIGLNVVTFAILVMCLLRMKADQMYAPKPSTNQDKGGFIAALRYVKRRPDLVVLLLAGLAVAGLGFNYNISNAVMATTEFNKGSAEFGALGSIMGIGALTAALWSARQARLRLRHVLVGMAGYVVFNLASALSPSYPIFAGLQAPVGLFTIMTLVCANSLLQTATAPHMRGRVMALWGLAFMGATPFVSPVIGWIGDTFGPRWTLAFGIFFVGVALVGITTWVMRSDHLRLRFDRHAKAPWLRLERGLTEDMPDPRR